MVWIDFQMPPDQPIREAIAIADHQAPRDHQLVVAFLTADQAGMLYRDRAQDHPLIVAPSPRAFFAAERRARKDTTHLPWIIISYESIVRDAAPGSWAEVTRQYRLVERLAGRVSGVAIYAPRE
jgi:hypothetical protein